MENPQIADYYINQFLQLYEGPVWFGESYLEKFREINERMAFMKPSEKVHSIAELVSHCVYWRRALINVLEGGVYTQTEADKENWLSNEVLKIKGWENLKEQLSATQHTIIRLLKPMKEDGFLKEFRKKQSVGDLVAGVIQHDIYHLGQIGLVKRMIG